MELPSDPPHGSQGAGRLTNRAGADTSPAARQAAPHRDDAPHHRRRVRERLLEPSSVQRRVQQALWNPTDTAPESGEGRGEHGDIALLVRVAADVSSAARLV